MRARVQERNTPAGRGRRRLAQSLLAAGLAAMAAGCSTVSAVKQGYMAHEDLERQYGTISLSRPYSLPLDTVLDKLDADIQRLTYDAAIAEASKFQSAAYRRRTVSQRAGLRVSADLLAAQQMMQAAQAGAQAAPGATPPAAPNLPTVADLAVADAAALPESPSLAVAHGRRMQVAFNNIMLSRLGASNLDILNELKKENDVHVVFQTMTVIPGELTRFNSIAQIRTVWSDLRGGKDGVDDRVKVVPLFPTYDAVAELNDAAALQQTQLFLAALAQYGPAQAQGEYQRATRDLQRLVSASERVTLVGSAIDGNATQYQVAGVRVARPLQEMRPRGTIQMEPLVLPVVTLVAVPKKTISGGKPGEIQVYERFSTRWVRTRPWWDKLPPGTFLPGFWYDRGTRFKSPEYRPWSWSLFAPETWFKTQAFEFVKVTARAGVHEAAVVANKAGQDPKPLDFHMASVAINHPYDQVIVVGVDGDRPKAFYVDGMEVPARAVKDGGAIALPIATPSLLEFADPGDDSLLTGKKTPYALFLSQETIRNLAKSRGRNAEFGNATPSVGGAKNAEIFVTAVNATGHFKGPKITLNFDTILDPAETPRETFSVQRGNESTTFTRSQGELWPLEAYCCPDFLLGGTCTCAP